MTDVHGEEPRRLSVLGRPASKINQSSVGALKDVQAQHICGPAPAGRAQVVFERVMLGMVLAGLAYIAHHYFAAGHLPRPFNSDPSQSLMDFYNTAYWANRAGAYEIWHTVYPPLSFLLTRLVTDAGCYAGSAYEARSCNPAGAMVVFSFYLLNVVLVFLSLRKVAAGVAVPRTLTLCLGLPMLYGLELANLIIPCFTVFVLAEGDLLRSRWLRNVCRGVAFNFKLYLLVTLLPLVLQRRIRWFAAAAFIFVAVYLATWPFYSEGTPWALFADIVFYSREQAKLYLAQNHLGEISSASGDIWNRILPAILRIGQAVAFLGLSAGLMTRGPVERRRLSILALSILSSEAAISTQGFSADYTQIFLLFLIFREREWTAGPRILLGIAYLLCFTVDHTLVETYRAPIQSFLSGRMVNVEFGLTLSQFVRPLLITGLQVALAVLLWCKAREILVRKRSLQDKISLDGDRAPDRKPHAFRLARNEK